MIVHNKKEDILQLGEEFVPSFVSEQREFVDGEDDSVDSDDARYDTEDLKK